MPLDEVLVSGGGDHLGDEERERLHEALRESIRQMKAGQAVDAVTALAGLRAGADNTAKVEKEPPPG